MLQKENFLVIGLGRFGSNVAKVLYENGHDVLGVDDSIDAVQTVIDAKLINNAMQLDATDSNSLKKIEIEKFAAVIVAIGSSIEDSVLVTANLRELGVKKIIAKASTEMHGKILDKLGVEKIVYPEAEMGRSLAKQIIGLNTLDEFALSEDISIAEVMLPKEFHGKSLSETNIRSSYGLNILAIRRAGGDFSLTLTPQTTLQPDDYLLVIGHHLDIDRFQEVGEKIAK
jgi:trk system potassium uptake protein TrkA